MNRLRPLGAVKGLAEPPHRAELRVALLHQLVAVQGGWGQASGLGSGFVSFTRARPPTADAGRTRRHEGTKRQRGEALGCTPSEATRPPPARGAHEGTKARRDGGGRRWGALRVKPPIHRRRGRTRRHEGTKRRRHEETEGGDSPRRCCLHESPPIHHRRGTHTNRKTSGSGLETSGVEARCLASRGQGGVDRRDHRAMVDPGVVTQSPPSRRERPPVRGNSYWPSP